MRKGAFGVWCGYCLLSVEIVSAQVVPTTPLRFDTRPLGDVLVPSDMVVVERKNPDLVRVTTHVVLSPIRGWTNLEGVVRHGQLVGMDDVVRVMNRDEAASLQPTLPDMLPVTTRDGKVRLLINDKTYKVEIKSLSEEDAAFVMSTQVALEKQEMERKKPAASVTKEP